MASNLTSEELSKWGERVTASDWSWSTWKWFLGDTFLILIWVLFMLTFFSMLIPRTRKRIVLATGRAIKGSSYFGAFIFTWTAALLAHPAIFGPGPYSYWIYQLLGPSSFASVEDWTFRYMTLFGLVTW